MFGTKTRERRKSVSHDWNIAVLRAHGHKPTFKRGKLDAASRKLFQHINLHMHDLRRECGSQMLEAGVGIHEVREWLGHRDISTTGRYLAITGASQRALTRLEESQKVPNKKKTKKHWPRRNQTAQGNSVSVN